MSGPELAALGSALLGLGLLTWLLLAAADRVAAWLDARCEARRAAAADDHARAFLEGRWR